MSTADEIALIIDKPRSMTERVGKALLGTALGAATISASLRLSPTVGEFEDENSNLADVTMRASIGTLGTFVGLVTVTTSIYSAFKPTKTICITEEELRKAFLLLDEKKEDPVPRISSGPKKQAGTKSHKARSKKKTSKRKAA